MTARSKPDTTPASVARAMLEVMLQVQRQPGDETAATLYELGLSITQLRALTILDVGDDLAIKDLAAALSLSLPAASRTVDALHGMGLVERREDAEDRRVKRISLTDAGREAYRRVNQARFGAFEQFAARLSEDERARLLDALAPVVARSEAGR